MTRCSSSGRHLTSLRPRSVTQDATAHALRAFPDELSARCDCSHNDDDDDDDDDVNVTPLLLLLLLLLLMLINVAVRSPVQDNLDCYRAGISGYCSNCEHVGKFFRSRDGGSEPRMS